MNAAALHFDAATHTYTVAGERWPSVTQVLSLLEDWSAVPEHVREAAKERGRCVHEAIALDVRGQLDWVSLDDVLVPYLEGWQRFVADSGVVIVASEFRVAHPELRVAGTLDLDVVLSGCHGQIDIKSGWVPHTVGYQTAGYEGLRARMLGLPKPDPRRKRWCLQLNPKLSRGYKLHPLTDKNDWNSFVSCLNTWRLRQKVNMETL